MSVSPRKKSHRDQRSDPKAGKGTSYVITDTWSRYSRQNGSQEGLLAEENFELNAAMYEER
jgi:ornithine carbamoyltransferase